LNILFATWNENKFNWLKDGFQCLGLPMMVEIEERSAHFLSCVSLLFPTGEQATLTIAETGRDTVEPFDHRRNAMAKAVGKIKEWIHVL
jgi:inosine/xanthosine triphosphate pyrophosphatase family protein